MRFDGCVVDAILYHGETWELMGRRWGKIEKDFYTKNKIFDISKIPDIYDCIKYDLQHNQHTLQFEHAEELYIYAKYLADIVIPQVAIEKKMLVYFLFIIFFFNVGIWIDSPGEANYRSGNLYAAS